MTEEVKVDKKTTKTVFKPNGARFLIQGVKQDEKKTKGGIIIPGGKDNSLTEVVTII